MFVAHGPAAWLAARAFSPRRSVVVAAVIGGLLPDVDMLWWLLDGGRVHHHAYPTHWPVVWVAVVAIGLFGAALMRRSSFDVVVAVGAGGIIHMILDTVAGDIRWLAPLEQTAFSLVTVPATQSHWVLSFLLHWTFLVELLICAVAAAMWRAHGPHTTRHTKKTLQ